MSPFNSQKGYVLIVTMMVLVILSLIGISATNTSFLELLISGNDRNHKETFYQADGTTEMSERILFENAVCQIVNSAGFSSNLIGDNMVVENTTFSENLVDRATFDGAPIISPAPSTFGNRDLVIYPNGTINGAIPTIQGGGSMGATNDANNPERTNIIVQGNTRSTQGFGQAFVSGYDGLAVGAAGGGTERRYKIATSHVGKSRSLSTINVRWRLNTSVLNSTSTFDCNY